MVIIGGYLPFLKQKQMKDKDRIKQLEEQLKVAQNPYIHEIHSLHCSDGELYIGYEGFKDRTIIINVDTFYKDLPSIISMVSKENTKQQEMYADMIKESLDEL
tara:strand:+ start:906 stop:1214 length:309 start_codon:yes stop_codon:yes gene_type:complete